MGTAWSEDNPVDPATFEHMDTGFPLRGAHEHLTCEQCHVRGIFKGTPMRCQGCHLYATDMEASKKPADHIPTVQDCDVCHDAFRPNVSWQLVNMNHVGIVANCASCHNNIQAPGKQPGHIVTSAPCEDCHRSTATWEGAGFDHAGISSGCARCHNNVQALGQPSNHIPVPGVACEICHDPQRFTSFAAPKMNHEGAGIIATCQRCHEAGNIYGITSRPNPPHPTASQAPDCSTCHLNTRSFLPVFTR